MRGRAQFHPGAGKIINGPIYRLVISQLSLKSLHWILLSSESHEVNPYFEIMTVNLKEALSIIHGKQLFDVEFVTADKRRQTGGEFKTLTGCRINKKEQMKPGPGSKARNHYRHATRTIIPAQGHPVDVHIFLITKINGKEVSLY